MLQTHTASSYFEWNEVREVAPWINGLFTSCRALFRLVLGMFSVKSA